MYQSWKKKQLTGRLLPSVRCILWEQIQEHSTENRLQKAAAYDENFILHPGTWKTKLHLGHIIDEEWSIYGKYKTQL